jgi:uncharacterized protein YkwD
MPADTDKDRAVEEPEPAVAPRDRVRRRARGCLSSLIILVILFAGGTLAVRALGGASRVAELSNVVTLSTTTPADPKADLPWRPKNGGVVRVQEAFNLARTAENEQLGTNVPMLQMPPQAQWDAMTDGEKALWLINHERTARGLSPLWGLDSHVSAVSQRYAQYILHNNKPLAHDANGQTPGERLAADPTIAACEWGWLENLAAYWTDAPTVPVPVEQAVYDWMYADGSCCEWGHRHNVLSSQFWLGPSSGKGLLGVGVARGGPYQGLPHGVIVVMDAVNPCPLWNYATPAPPTPTPAGTSGG